MISKDICFLKCCHPTKKIMENITALPKDRNGCVRVEFSGPFLTLQQSDSAQA
jgi:hypothetical protein